MTLTQRLNFALASVVALTLCYHPTSRPRAWTSSTKVH